MSESNPTRRSWVPAAGPGPSSSPDADDTPSAPPVPRPWKPEGTSAPAAPTTETTTPLSDAQPPPVPDVAPSPRPPSFLPSPPVDQTQHHTALSSEPDDHALLDIGRRRSRRARAVLAALVVLVIALAGTSGYLYRTSHAWEDRAEQYATTSSTLGSTLAETKRDLSGARAELEAVTTQLTTAQARIIELADEKAQVGDDREAQRLVADYQARVSDAAGRVALALDQCVQGQNQLIGYLATPERFDEVELDQYASDVAALCTAATDANDALQVELGQ